MYILALEGARPASISTAAALQAGGLSDTELQ